jgi:hypothetical protein
MVNRDALWRSLRDLVPTGLSSRFIGAEKGAARHRPLNHLDLVSLNRVPRPCNYKCPG